VKSLGSEPNYDLYGIINHYGSLTGGHYMSVVKNVQTNEWFQYNDQKRSAVSE